MSTGFGFAIAISTGWIVTIVLLVVLIAAVVALYFQGKRMQKKQEEADAQADAMKQWVTMLVIDKKKMRLTDANLPQIVVDQTPRLMRWSKVPILKVKAGPQITNLICDNRIFDMVPVKQEVKAAVAGIYVTEVKSLRGGKLAEPVKKGFFARTMDKARAAAGAGPKK